MTALTTPVHVNELTTFVIVNGFSCTGYRIMVLLSKGPL